MFGSSVETGNGVLSSLNSNDLLDSYDTSNQTKQLLPPPPTNVEITLGPGSFTLKCNSNGDGRTATVIWNLNAGPFDTISIDRVRIFHRRGKPPSYDSMIRRPGGFPFDSDTYDIAFPGPGLYRIETKEGSFVTFVKSGNFNIPTTIATCFIGQPDPIDPLPPLNSLNTNPIVEV